MFEHKSQKAEYKSNFSIIICHCFDHAENDQFCSCAYTSGTEKYCSSKSALIVPVN